METIKTFYTNTPTITFTIVDDDGSIFDLTGYTIKLYGKEKFTDTVYLFEKTCTHTVPQDALGVCETTLLQADTDDVGVAVCELELVNGISRFSYLFYLSIRQSVK